MNTMKITGNACIAFGIVVLLMMPSFAIATDNLYDQAVTAYVKKDFKTAVRLLKEYTKETPDASAYYLLGYALYKQRNFAESARYFQEAYTLDPNASPDLLP